nr:hypothetical protein [Glycomyces xiaoerkulensis]
MCDDMVFDGFDGHPGEVAFAAGSSEAQEVEVVAAGLGLGALQGESPLAAGAVHQSFEVVVPLAVPGPGVALNVEHLLDLVEQLGRHERLVAAVVFASFVGDFAEVVAVL